MKLMPDGYGGPQHARMFLAFVLRFFPFLPFSFRGRVPVPTRLTQVNSQPRILLAYHLVIDWSAQHGGLSILSGSSASASLKVFSRLVELSSAMVSECLEKKMISESVPAHALSLYFVQIQKIVGSHIVYDCFPSFF